MKFLFSATLFVAVALPACLAKADITDLQPTESVMTSAFFFPPNNVRGYAGDNRPVFRVSSNNAFGVGPETIYLAFDPSAFGSLTAPVASATLTMRSVDGGFGANAGPGNPFLVSAHSVAANPFTSITDDTNPGGTVTPIDFFNNSINASDPSARTSINAIDADFQFDVTSIVNEWVSGGNPNFVIALTGKDDVQVGDGFLHGFANNTESAGVTRLSVSAVPEPSHYALLAVLTCVAAFTGITRRIRNRRNGGENEEASPQLQA